MSEDLQYQIRQILSEKDLVTHNHVNQIKWMLMHEIKMSHSNLVLEMYRANLELIKLQLVFSVGLFLLFIMLV